MRWVEPILGRQVSAEKASAARELRRRMTPAERTLWAHLRAHRLNGLHFRRQQVIDGFIIDFYCHAVGLVVEVDGPVHQDQAGHDEERDRVLANGGRHVLRVTNADVFTDLAGVLRRISNASLRSPDRAAR